MLLATLPLAGPAGTAGTTLAVTATVLSKNVCKFSGPHSVVLDFLTIDPGSAVPQTAALTVDFVCNGSSPTVSYFLGADDGLWSSTPGSRRMQHTVQSGEYLPYSLVLSPTSGMASKGETQTLSILGSIAPADFQQALVGPYADRVILTVAP